MFNQQTTKETNDIKFKRFNNYFLYFFAFKLPLTSSSSHRPVVNYFKILIARKQQKKNSETCLSLDANTNVVHNLIINNIFNFYL